MQCRFSGRGALRWILLFALLSALLFAPQLWLKIRYSDLIYPAIEAVPAQEVAIVFGAWVKQDRSLSDVTRERVEAGVRLYRSGKVRKLFLSGDNRSNQQAEAMAAYAIDAGVDPNDIIVDQLGIDTHDTCRHFAAAGTQAILITQGYHLPRAMWMCETSRIRVTGLAVDRLDILNSRGNNWLQIYTIRASRTVREAVLTWAFVLGIYDRLSTEAEKLEQIQ